MPTPTTITLIDPQATAMVTDIIARTILLPEAIPVPGIHLPGTIMITKE
jgi:hypothetical protein